ncbi:MAG: hypothetical protein ABEJ80_02650 [Halarchaeum sp.]
MPPATRDPVTLLGVALALLVAAVLVGLHALSVLPAPTAIRSGFALAAAVVAVAVARLTRDGAPIERAPLSGSNTARVCVSLAALAVLATALTGSRLLPVAAALVPGYLLVAALLARRDPPVRSTLVSLAALLLTPAVTKYLTTDVFFGGTDTFAHVAALRRLLATGYTTALPDGYDYFPVFHLLTGAVARVADLAPYDAIVLTGIAFTVAVLLAVYAVAARLFDDTRLALCAAAAFCLMEFSAYHALYFFPQALATGLFVVGVYATASVPAAARAATVRRHAVYLLSLVGALTLTHHLTYVFFLALLAVVLAAVRARDALAARDARLPARLRALAAAPPSPLSRTPYRVGFPLVVGGLAVLAYLVLSPSLILFGIAGGVYGAFLASGAGAGPGTFPLGVALPVDSVANAVAWLATPTGVYYALLGAVLLVGVYALLRNVRAYAAVIPLVLAGAALAVVLFPLPVTLPQVERVQYAVTFVALAPLAVGLAHALRASARSRRAVIVGVVLVAALGAVTPLTHLAAGDLNGVYLDERGAQVTMSADEYAALDGTASYLAARTTGNVSADYVATRALASEPTPAAVSADGLAVSADGLSAPPGYLVARDPWASAFVPVAVGGNVFADEMHWFTTTHARYRRALAVNDRVRDAGPVSVLADPRGFRGVLGNETATR